MLKAFRSYLSDLDSDMRQYQIGVNRIFVRKFTLPRHYATYFLEVLAETSRLYLDNLTLRKLEPRVPAKLASRAADKRSIRAKPSAGAVIETTLRKRLTKRIESLPGWSEFHPRNEFVTENFLKTPADYMNRLTLHLPEIYGETVNLNNCVRGLLDKGPFPDCYLAELEVGLEHVAHHASYCRHTLEILSDEDNWRTGFSVTTR